GERVLLPAVRKADEDTLIIADGFSCREQIAQLTSRHAVHVAEVLAFAARQDQLSGRKRSNPGRLERDTVRARRRSQKKSMMRAGLFIAAAAGTGIYAGLTRRRT